MIDQIEIPEFHPYAKLYLVSYLSQGHLVKGYLAIPRGEGPFPLFIYCRGGLRNIGMTKLAWIDTYVSEGWMVFAPFYRGNRGGEGREDFGGEDRYDVIEAVPLLESHPLVDKNQIHIFGFSRGAIPALFAATQYPCIASAAIWGGVTDLLLTYDERVDMRRMLKRLLGGSPGKVQSEYDRRSPVFFAHELLCPVLIIHGKRDAQVGVDHAYRLAEMLETHRKPYETWIRENQGHHFSLEDQKVTKKKMLEWMRNRPREGSV